MCLKTVSVEFVMAENWFKPQRKSLTVHCSSTLLGEIIVIKTKYELDDC